MDPQSDPEPYLVEAVLDERTSDLIRNGRDELNLAEFPLALIGDRAPKGVKTLSFEDAIRDKGTGEIVTRKLTISASDKYGLPTAIDDDVVVALMALTKQTSGFTSRTVTFSRYQLLQLLGWPDKGQSYERLEESLRRWVGVTLYYEKAWWDKKLQSWVNENFHILDNVTLYDLETRQRHRKRGQGEVPLSTFTWNEVIFRSFHAENLKKLDLGTYFKIRLAPARRMYRFLDKRFYRRSRWQFNLREFACEHVGFSRGYDMAQLRRKIQPAIEELETVGFLEPLSPDERYAKVSRGVWNVLFIRKKEPVPVEALQRLTKTLERDLVGRGVTAATALELVVTFPTDRIRVKLEVFDWLTETRDPRVSKNPAGYLVQSIRSDYAPPKGFEPAEVRSAKRKAVDERAQRQIAAMAKREAEEKARHEAERGPLDAYWRSLTLEEQKRLEAEAIRTAEPWIRERVLAAGDAPNSFTEAFRQSVIDNAIRKILSMKAAG